MIQTNPKVDSWPSENGSEVIDFGINSAALVELSVPAAAYANPALPHATYLALPHAIPGPASRHIPGPASRLPQLHAGAH